MTPKERADRFLDVWGRSPVSAATARSLEDEFHDAIAEEREATIQRVIEYCRKENRYLPLGLQDAIQARQL